MYMHLKKCTFCPIKRKDHNHMYSKDLLNMFTLYAMGYGRVFLREMIS